jgi:hypothetical protein
MNKTTPHHLDSVHTVSEKDSTPEIAAIFADIKETLGVPFVNLIWRHLATIPGGLEMTWSLARPLYGSTTLNASARALRQQTTLVDRVMPWPDAVCTALGLSEKDKSEIVLLLEDYGHANSRALLVLSYLHASLSADSRSINKGEHQGAHASALIDPLAHIAKNKDALIKPARPLPATADLPANVVALIKILNTFGAPIPSPAEPSLYRHLSYWPRFLAAFWLAVEPLERQGVLVREGINIYERASSMVRQWKPADNASEIIAPNSVSQVLKSLDHFTFAVIARMIVHGDMMKRMID